MDPLAVPILLSAAEGGTSLIALLTIFVLAIYVGVEVIVKVPPTLHTPLMSGSNAISGITVVGSILAVIALSDGSSSEIGRAHV